MDQIGKPERETQNRVIKLFKERLGYDYLGNWEERENNRNVEPELLKKYLKRCGYEDKQISDAIFALTQAADNPTGSLYQNNEAVYMLLCYGAKVQVSVDRPHDDVYFIDWEHPERNDFAIAEEVTLHGAKTRRPDLVLYVNGIALGVIELKSSRVSLHDGIRQLISNQKKEYNEPFFTTAQILIAGNDSDPQGLRYGTVGTPEKYYLAWKEDCPETFNYLLDKYLFLMCEKRRLLEIVHDFIVFDDGKKKLPRVHQYFGVKAAQQRVRKREGGIIWHTQGSGKSIVMVLLATWILRWNPNARVLIVTDREELDDQIKRVFENSGTKFIERATSGADLMSRLRDPAARLVCTLIHKFGKKDIENFEEYIAFLKNDKAKTYGEIFVFVDECHRTQSARKDDIQSGKLHRLMKAVLDKAVFIGFTGTPLRQEDRQTSLAVFGSYIHTYKFKEAVEDKVVLDLVYESRDVPQHLSSAEGIDDYFESRTRLLNDWQRRKLQEKWGTMQNLLSSRDRIDRIAKDIAHDFMTRPRLDNDRGTAMLVADSILDACKYYEAFQQTPLKGKCAIITSYDPQGQNMSLEATGEELPDNAAFKYETYTKLLADAGFHDTESYEKEMKRRFEKERANMKLLIVVDKLLTGFDAPGCTYLYIDKSLRDHGLFQAICRTNRLDGDDKLFGIIVDYKGQLEKVADSIKVYTSELAHEEGEAVDPEVLMQGRLAKGREKLNAALEKLDILCKQVPHPRTDFDYRHYFCGEPENPDDLKKTEPLREALYESVASLVRAYANIADGLAEAGYTPVEISQIETDVKHYEKLRETIRVASGENIDLKAYDADMRYLIDEYIEAEKPETISPFKDMTLLDLIAARGIEEACKALPDSIAKDSNAVAESIENNVRRKVIQEQVNDPAFYSSMSKLLDDLIAARKDGSLKYHEYLKKMAELADALRAGKLKSVPQTMNTPGRIALYNNLGENAELADKVDIAVKQAKPADWRGNLPRERAVKAILAKCLDDNDDDVDRIFRILFEQKEY